MNKKKHLPIFGHNNAQQWIEAQVESEMIGMSDGGVRKKQLRMIGVLREMGCGRAEGILQANEYMVTQ